MSARVAVLVPWVGFGRPPVRLAAAVLLTWLASMGCGTAAGPAEPAPAGPAGPNVNRLVMAVVPPLGESNETRHLGSPRIWPLRPMYEYLIGMDPESGKQAPQLATEWRVEPNGQTFRFKLRQGVQFHGGHGQFEGKDLQQPLIEVSKDDSLAGAAPFWRQAVKNIEVLSPHEVLYHLQRPDGQFLSTLSEDRGGMEIFSKNHFDKIGPPKMTDEPLAGTGPYAFQERAQSVYVRFRRTAFPHWRTTPDFPEFEFRLLKESSTRLAALLTGEAHLADLSEDLKVNAQKQGFESRTGRVSALRLFMTIYCCFLNDPKDPGKGYVNTESPLLDLRVRKALDKAINREAINRAFLGGRAQLMMANPFNPSRLGWDPQWEQLYWQEYGYDPAAAKQLLADAGYGPTNPLKTNIFLIEASGFANGPDMAEAIAAYWTAIGVKADLLKVDTDEMTRQSRLFKYTNHYAIVGTSSDVFTGTTSRGYSFGSRGSGLEAPDADAAMFQVNNTLDEKRQDELFRRIGTVRLLQHQSGPLFWVPAEILVNPRIVGAYLYPGAVTGTFSHVQNIKAAR